MEAEEKTTPSIKTECNFNVDSNTNMFELHSFLASDAATKEGPLGDLLAIKNIKKEPQLDSRTDFSLDGETHDNKVQCCNGDLEPEEEDLGTLNGTSSSQPGIDKQSILEPERESKLFDEITIFDEFEAHKKEALNYIRDEHWRSLSHQQIKKEPTTEWPEVVPNKPPTPSAVVKLEKSWFEKQLVVVCERLNDRLFASLMEKLHSAKYDKDGHHCLKTPEGKYNKLSMERTKRKIKIISKKKETQPECKKRTNDMDNEMNLSSEISELDDSAGDNTNEDEEKSRLKWKGKNQMRRKHESLYKERKPSKLSCPHCDYETYNYSSLRRHKLSKHEELVEDKPIKSSCPHCKYKTYNNCYLKKHMLTRHEHSIVDKPSKQNCPHCDYKTDYYSRLRLHKLNKHEELLEHKPPKLGCPHCKYNTYYNFHLKKHMLTRHEDLVEVKLSKHSCPHCDYKTYDKTRLSQHKLNKHEEWVEDKPPKYCCPHCDYETYHRRNLRHHMLQKHEELVENKPPKHSCPHCDFESHYKANWQRHILQIHDKLVGNKRPKHSCPHCDYKTYHKTHMKRHILKRHEELKKNPPKHRCPHCDYETYDKIRLREHMLNKHELVQDKPPKHFSPHCKYKTYFNYALRKRESKKHKELVEYKQM